MVMDTGRNTADQCFPRVGDMEALVWYATVHSLGKAFRQVYSSHPLTLTPLNNFKFLAEATHLHTQ